MAERARLPPELDEDRQLASPPAATLEDRAPANSYASPGRGSGSPRPGEPEVVPA